MHHFDNGSEPGSARQDRRRRRAKFGGQEGISAGQNRRPPQGARLGAQELIQPLGRAQRRPSAEAAGTRDLPGLMRGRRDAPRSPERRRPGSVRALSPVRIPAQRSPFEYGQAVPMNGHEKTSAGAGDDVAVLHVNGRLAGRDFRKIADGIAITPMITVVLPVMNEAANLPGVFASLPHWISEVVLVDGRSSDGSINVARQLRPDVKVVLQGGAGKGDALAAGFAAATGDIIVAIDADGSTDGHEIVRFVSALLSGADFAKGSRFSSAGSSDDITTLRRYGNRLLNITVNSLFGTSFTDLCYGYNAFWARHLGKLAVDTPGFEVETLLMIRAATAGLSVYEVPSHERPRQHGVSNLSAVRDGWRILRLIAAEKWHVRRQRAARPKPFMAPGRLANTGERPVIEPSQDSGRGQLLDGVIYRSSRQAGR